MFLPHKLDPFPYIYETVISICDNTNEISGTYGLCPYIQFNVIDFLYRRTKCESSLGIGNPNGKTSVIPTELGMVKKRSPIQRSHRNLVQRFELTYHFYIALVFNIIFFLVLDN